MDAERGQVQATVLIVEDHDVVRGLLREWLESTSPQCRVIEATDGEEAILLVQAWAPHLVVMDIGLPQMNGLEATRCIKAIVPETEVVVMATFEDETYLSAAIMVGASACVAKWKVRTELLSRLERVLSTRDERSVET